MGPKYENREFWHRLTFKISSAPHLLNLTINYMLYLSFLGCSPFPCTNKPNKTSQTVVCKIVDTNRFFYTYISEMWRCAWIISHITPLPPPPTTMLIGEHDAVDDIALNQHWKGEGGDENPNSCAQKIVRISQSVSRYFANDCLRAIICELYAKMKERTWWST